MNTPPATTKSANTMTLHERYANSLDRISRLYYATARSIKLRDIKQMSPRDKVFVLRQLSQLQKTVKKIEPYDRYKGVDISKMGPRELEEMMLYQVEMDRWNR